MEGEFYYSHWAHFSFQVQINIKNEVSHASFPCFTDLIGDSF